jgi:hypothetical protein
MLLIMPMCAWSPVPVMGGLPGYALHYETFRKLRLTADEKPRWSNI